MYILKINRELICDILINNHVDLKVIFEFPPRMFYGLDILALDESIACFLNYLFKYNKLHDANRCFESLSIGSKVFFNAVIEVLFRHLPLKKYKQGTLEYRITSYNVCYTKLLRSSMR